MAEQKRLVWACRMEVRRVMDVDGLGWKIVRKRVRSVVLAEKRHWSDEIYRTLEGKVRILDFLKEGATSSEC